MKFSSIWIFPKMLSIVGRIGIMSPSGQCPIVPRRHCPNVPIQQLSTFTTDDKWCHLLCSLEIAAPDVQRNTQKCVYLNVPCVPYFVILRTKFQQLQSSGEELLHNTAHSTSFITILFFQWVNPLLCKWICVLHAWALGFVYQKAWRVPLLGLQPLDTSSFSVLNTSLLWLSRGTWTD